MQYKQVHIGDLKVLTEPIFRKRSAECDIAMHTEDFVVKINDAKKTLRVYRGGNALHVSHLCWQLSKAAKFCVDIAA